MRIKLVISYDGTDFCGWQRQKNGISIQQTVEEAVFCLTQEKVTVTASGRTDAGVHAEGQVAHFDTNSSIPPEKFAKALNVFLPNTVKVLSSELVKNDFHSVKSAKKKTYVYRFYISDIVLPLKERYATKVFGDINVKKMQKAGKLIEGEHDFKCFSATGSNAKTTVRTVYSVTVEKNGIDLTVSVCGNGFLYNMVRIIAGTLIKIGKGELDEDNIKKAFLTGDRKLLGATIPAKGLCLLKADYD